ncbi:MFS transporter small subunit [Arthrobacter sp. KK5.5]
MATARQPQAHDVRTKPAVGRLAVGWLLVGVPLLYGIVQTLTRVAQLFQ